MCNLLTNAITHNNHEKENVTIKIRCNFDEKSNQAYIEIIDNGPGIPADIIEQIFDPFFTTSP